MDHATAPRPIRESHLRDELPGGNTMPGVAPAVLDAGRVFNNALDRAAQSSRRHSDLRTPASEAIAERSWARLMLAEKRLRRAMEANGVVSFAVDGRIIAGPSGHVTDDLLDCIALTVLSMVDVDGLMKGGDR